MSFVQPSLLSVLYSLSLQFNKHGYLPFPLFPFDAPRALGISLIVDCRIRDGGNLQELDDHFDGVKTSEPLCLALLWFLASHGHCLCVCVCVLPWSLRRFYL